jgi:AraC family transcriptional regulator of adaptative response / DNA-3-methyladenine glycosylase II
LDDERCWQAVETGDSRFDGWIFCGVTSTGIYCRPSCPARTPKRANVRFFATAAAAQGAGFRACKRCRPDASPGSPEWDRRADVVGRAMRLIADGVVDREGVSGLAAHLGYSERHLHRQLVAVVGAGPLALARAQRAQTARTLLETTDLRITDVAFAAGFASVRQFNATVREVFAAAPRDLRAGARRRSPRAAGAIELRLPYRAPLDADGLIAYLGLRAVAGIEEVAGGAYRRSLDLPRGPGVVELWPTDGHVRARFWLEDLGDLATAVQRCRALLDLDSDPAAIDAALGGDPLLRPLVAASPGRRVAGHVDGHELAIRAVLGQQVTLAAAATLAARLVADHGVPLRRPLGEVTHLFPSAATLADVDPGRIAMPAARKRALLGLARAVADGEVALDGGAERDETQRRLLAMPGLGPWTVGYVAMRALRDPDAFLPTDLGVRRALEGLGRDGRPPAAASVAERWRPYRAYALQHLWGHLATSGPGVVATRSRLAA